MIKEVLPIMRKQKNGIIINISSMSGIIGIPATSVYVSTKFALEGLSESISYELQPYGIKVILIEAGVINTNFVPNFKLPITISNKFQESFLIKDTAAKDYVDDKKKRYSDYSGTVDTFLSHYYLAMKRAPLPQKVSTVILESIKTATNSSDCLFRYTVGEDAKTFANAKRKMTDSQLHKFIVDKLLH